MMNKESLDLEAVKLGVRQSLEHLQRVGVSHLPIADPVRAGEFASLWNTEPETAIASVSQTNSQVATAVESVKPSVTATPAVPVSLTPAAASGPGTYVSESLPIAGRAEALASWEQQVAACTKCHELSCTRKQTVFGEGNAEARVCFFGEAPGADEDHQGRPFVGRAGQLLTKIIEACKFRREDVYLLNTLKCRPPGNRNPLPDELTNCRPFFETQLEIIQPDYIVCLGLFAAQSLLETTLSIGQMRGRFHTYLGSKVVVTYHPSYLLRNEKMKGAAWQDMQMMMRDMGLL